MATIDRSIGAFHDSSSSRLRKIGRYVGPNPYVTGGDPLNAADVGLGQIEHFDPGIATNGTLYRSLVYLPNPPPSSGGGLVRWLDGTTGLEIAAGADLSGYACRFEVVGH
jgi:hypothetical protein